VFDDAAVVGRLVDSAAAEVGREGPPGEVVVVGGDVDLELLRGDGNAVYLRLTNSACQTELAPMLYPHKQFRVGTKSIGMGTKSSIMLWVNQDQVMLRVTRPRIGGNTQISES
jgi:hypothetical protein